MMMKRAGAVLVSVATGLALAVASAAPANAADPTIDADGTVTIGDAHWHFDQYGLAYGWDAADVYDLDGYIFYPNEFYANGYLYCGTQTQADLGTVTVESNGDLTIACPAAPWGTTGLTASLSFRVYQPADGGYLVRQLVTISNGTAVPIDIDGSFSALNYEGYTGTQYTDGFLSSLGGDHLEADDTWYISHDTAGASVVETESWARSGSAPGAGIVANDGPQVDFSAADSLFAPGETKYFASFTHMVIPATQDEAGAEAAFALALAQTPEFASFSGRLIAGLPEGITVVGWGTTPVTPALAATGASIEGSGILLGGAVAVLLVGGALLAVRRARA
jgi:hypothetical protein